MKPSVVSPEFSAQTMFPISADEVIFSFLKASTETLSSDIRQKLEAVIDNNTYQEKLICREICRSIDKLEYFKARYWYRVSLTSRQLEFLRLGQESSNNFSKYFSDKTYKPSIAARNIRARSNLTEKREMHRDKVVRYSQSIESGHMKNVILCASNYTINRRLKVFDGNHRIIAYVLKQGELLPFSCIVGFSKPLYIGLMQRALLTFPFYSELNAAMKFSARNNARRVRSLISGGMNYQPLLKDRQALVRLSSSVDVRLDDSSCSALPAERTCAGRAKLLRDDMQSTIGELSGATLLDVGCNVGFFCHFFSSLGMRTVGIDNSQHNRNLRFSLSNSVRTARRMNRRYGLSCEFIEEDARKWMKHQTELFDVTLLLSVLHHFFLGYPMGEYKHDPMDEAKRFIEDIARMTRKVLYIEYEDGESSISVDELMEFLRSQKLFRDVSIFGHSSDRNRPMIRCAKI